MILNLINTLKNGGVVEKGTYEQLIKSGVIPFSIDISIRRYQRYMLHYHAFINLQIKDAQMTAITLTAEEYKCAVMTIYRDIKKIEHI